MARHHRGNLVALATLAGALAGCGGGGSANPPANPGPGNPGPANPGMGGDTYAITSANRLVSFNRATPTTSSVVSITGLQANETILGIDVRPGGMPAGQLLALSSMGVLYTIDPNSGAATLKSRLTADQTDMTLPYNGISGTRVSMDLNNLADALRVVTDTGQNLRINVDTGTTFTDAVMTVGGITTVGISEVAYTNNFPSTCRTTAYYLDTTADRLMTTVNAVNGILTPVGPLGVDAAAMTGFDIATGPDGTNAAFAVLTVNNTTSLYTINLTTGVATAVGAVANLNAGETIFGLAAPVPTTTPMQPMGELLALTVSNNIVSFNSNFPQKLCTTAAINGLQGGEAVLGIDLRPSDGNVYALTSGQRVYTVNPTTGSVTLKAALRAAAADTTQPFVALDGTSATVDVSPAADGLRVITNTGMNLRVLMDTGDTFTDTPLNPPGSTVTAIAYSNSFDGTAISTLYVVDTAGDRLMIQGGRAPSNPIAGNLTPVGSLNINTGDVNAIAGFDINGVTNTAIAAFSVGNSITSDLYSINLTTGAAIRINSIGTPDRIRALTYSSARKASLLGITSDARLISFSAKTPQTLTNSVAISGLQGGEQILGFDFRPSNGVLYLLTDGMRVYTLDPVTGIATFLSMQSRIGPTDPFTQLVGTSFGIDFSPTADAMRVISDNEQNLAVVVDLGATITASPLTRIAAEAGSPVPDVVAIAYTSNYAGTLDTTLYDIDLATNSLLSQRPANNGVLTTVGPLTTPAQTFSPAAGFDIVGGDDGLAVAALTPQGATQSTLYSVNFRTGALTPVSTIGPAGTAPLRGLTILFR